MSEGAEDGCRVGVVLLSSAISVGSRVGTRLGIFVGAIVGASKLTSTSCMPSRGRPMTPPNTSKRSLSARPLGSGNTRTVLSPSCRNMFGASTSVAVSMAMSCLNTCIRPNGRTPLMVRNVCRVVVGSAKIGDRVGLTRVILRTPKPANVGTSFLTNRLTRETAGL